MKKALVIAVASAVAAVAVTAASGGTQAQHSLKLVAVQHDFAQAGVGKKGPKKGSLFLFSERLTRDGKAYGDDHVVCTFTGTWPRETDFCHGLFELPDGTIVADGASARGPFTVAITGGTGAYAGARGELRSTPTKNGELLAFTFEQ
jgi:hypothetical protein